MTTDDETLCECGAPMGPHDLHCDDCATCVQCERVERADDMHEVLGNRWAWPRVTGGHYCDDCATECECCLEYRANSQMTEVRGEATCDDCMSEHYGYCGGCDEYFPLDDMLYSEHQGEDYCESCYAQYGTEDVEPEPAYTCHRCGSMNVHYHLLTEDFYCDCKVAARRDAQFVVLAHPIPDNVRAEFVAVG